MRKRGKAVILLSGGQDSTVCLYSCLKDFGKKNTIALTIDYGQRHGSEIAAASRIAKRAGVSHTVLTCSALAEIGSSSLTGVNEIRTSGGLQDSESPDGLPTTYVPSRNLVFFSIASSFAVTKGANTIYSGVCQTDYSGYPDCRRDFVQAAELACNLAVPSSCRPISIVTPLMDMDKRAITDMGVSLGADCWLSLADSITCYRGEKGGCGKCPSCLLRQKGFEEAGYKDPARQ